MKKWLKHLNSTPFGFTPAGHPLLASVGFTPNGVELVENGLDLKASCPG
jgi:hypothetical protein